MAHHPRPVMVLVTEHKLAEFISRPCAAGLLEASGVVAKGADYYVIFDNADASPGSIAASHPDRSAIRGSGAGARAKDTKTSPSAGVRAAFTAHRGGKTSRRDL